MKTLIINLETLAVLGQALELAKAGRVEVAKAAVSIADSLPVVEGSATLRARVVAELRARYAEKALATKARKARK
jgi:hypothetical protein